MSAASNTLPIVSVRYFHEGGRFWATFANWSGAADSLEQLRAVALDALAEFQGHPYRSSFFFHQTHPNVPQGEPFAHEEFWPEGMEPSSGTLYVNHTGPRAA